MSIRAPLHLDRNVRIDARVRDRISGPGTVVDRVTVNVEDDDGEPLEYVVTYHPHDGLTVSVRASGGTLEEIPL